MCEDEVEARLEELDRLLNDPAVPLDPDRVWALLAELARLTVPADATARTAG